MDTSEIFDVLDKGGLLVWPILLCSLLGMSIFFERIQCYRKIRKHSQLDAFNKSFALLRQGSIDQARLEAGQFTNPYNATARILIEALNLDKPDRETLEVVLMHAVENEVTNLSKNLSTLSVLASTAPLLGLLGTVLGMIKAFIVVESMGGGVNASVLAGGIWEAMLTTAMGLLVAIPLLFFHNFLKEKQHHLQQKFEDTAIKVLKSWPNPLISH